MACTMTHSMSPPSSLMGLPRELRDMEHQLCADTDRPTIVRLSPISFNWLDLMRTNGQVADEMRQIYRIPSYHSSTADQTWSAQLTLKNDEYALTWTSLPCPASCVRRLSIDFKINFTLSKFGHWDNDSKGKPGKIFQALLELLNQISHHGPNIIVSETLSRSIVFETLSLNVSFLDEEKPYLMPSGPESIYIMGYGKRRIYACLIEDIVVACGNNVLEQRVRNVNIQGPKSLGRPKTEIVIDVSNDKD
ncbi:hypothetical protein D6D17_02166 [Aureobasidium pullulans]|uniref:Uncharacterized protein n=1 Tax=Aureobasidium pullulans TaxID=5580 RepID=A0A4S9DF58_AURPU|nr:hypothetical protein D6D17_02166 [Aureobasidium pullulans]THY77316.1 hypothetical protein D6C94_02392 [Aureobasidium pullulans]THZ37680.1 hypothetical protein D6C87_08324 [Aureobasidium pullulans]TIA75692.1 hypothetical protein D6C76_05948 [Aureobasidium pullulans]